MILGTLDVVLTPPGSNADVWTDGLQFNTDSQALTDGLMDWLGAHTESRTSMDGWLHFHTEGQTSMDGLMVGHMTDGWVNGWMCSQTYRQIIEGGQRGYILKLHLQFEG